jgi:hypothetical protein
MIMAICEQFQQENGLVRVPARLQPYLPAIGDQRSATLLTPKPRKARLAFKYIRGPKYFEAKFKESRQERSSE